jgi:tripartite-type tricarboxylate transporter receptor subunit TctC
MSGAFMLRTAIAAVVTAMVSILPCTAQDYPTRPITIVVGFAPGGFADGVARVLGAKLSERLGQNVVIENRPGGGGNIAAAAVAKAPADGYTLLVTTTGLAVNETLSKQKSFSLDDIKVVAIPAWAPETLSVSPKSPAKTLADLLLIAREKPISYASPGVGTSGHIASAYLFKNLAKVETVHVPFQGGAPAVNAMLGGHVDALVGALPGYAGQLSSGQIRGLAVAAEQRLAQYPDIPTYAESGFPEMIASTWVGVFAPAKVDDAIAEKLNKTINEIVNEPGAQAQFKTLQTELRQADRADAVAFFRHEVEQWKKMIVSIGLAEQ